MDEQRLCDAGMAGAREQQPTPPSALLSATTRLMHFVAKYLPEGMEEAVAAAIKHAMSAFSGNLSDRLLLCACLGSLCHAVDNHNISSQQTLDVIQRQGIHDAIFTTLAQVMQVWSHIISVCIFSVTRALLPAYGELGFWGSPA